MLCMSIIVQNNKSIATIRKYQWSMSKFRISSGRGGAVAAGGGVVAAPILTFVPVPSVPRVRWPVVSTCAAAAHLALEQQMVPASSHLPLLHIVWGLSGRRCHQSAIIRWPILFYLTKSERKHFHVFFAWFTLYVALKRVVVLIKIEFDCITAAIYSQYSWFYFSCMVFCVCVDIMSILYFHVTVNFFSS